MKLKLLVSLVFLLASGVSNALNKTPTGFYYPLESFSYSSSGTWLGPGLGHAGPNGHIGVDMLAPKGTPVYAIADGEVLPPSLNGWGTGNVGVWVRHMIASGRYVKVLYGHIDGNTDVGSGEVKAGDEIGKLGDYAEPHLHFGVVDPGKEPEAPYGYTSDADHNNFIDPIAFIKTQKPVSSRCVGTVCGDIALYPAKLSQARQVRFGTSTYSVTDVGWWPIVVIKCEAATQHFYLIPKQTGNDTEFRAVPAPRDICAYVIQPTCSQ